ncbi:MAG: NUDIX hydrolase [Deltaproteobacteria bacterium]|nr:NUDIX hydrolase [Deltaproteobacteria bacterium]
MHQWKPKSVEVLFSHPLVELRRQQLIAAGEQRMALVLQMPDWVNVIAILPDDQVLFVRQWRYGLAQSTLEIPGGVVEPGEEELVGAQRELLEETGYRARTWKRLGEVHPNPAMQTNRTGTWVATDLERVGEAEGDGEEELELVLVPLKEVPRRIANGVITHSLVVAAFYLLNLNRAS